MERTLDTVLRSLGNPSIASGMLSRSPSPSAQTQGTQALLATPSPPQSPVMNGHHHRHQLSIIIILPPRARALLRVVPIHLHLPPPLPSTVSLVYNLLMMQLPPPPLPFLVYLKRLPCLL